MNSHKKLSGGYMVRLYMPMLAATNGTLSTTALTRPISITIRSWRPTVLSSQVATEDRTCVCSSTATASRIPMKNTTALMSMRVSARAKVRRCLRRSSSWRCTMSPTAHSRPKPNITPMKGGRWVTVLKIGTITRMPKPRKNISRLSKTLV